MILKVRDTEQVWNIDVFNQIVIKLWSGNGAIQISTYLICIGYLTFLLPYYCTYDVYLNEKFYALRESFRITVILYIQQE